jgi:UDP-GlcNAc:undecaprenyl-phosphate GlcNAc-1-phosphate transferase
LASVSNFTSEPSQRSSHFETIPNIGGLAFFVVIMVFYSFIYHFDESSIFPNLIPGLTILFIIGLKDDLVMVNPSTKIIAQLISAAFFVFHNSFSLLNFRGFLWIHDVSPILGICLTVFLTVALINAFNLLDGIDGFAAIVGIIIFTFFFVFFSYLGLYFLAFINTIILGSLFAFLYFNLSKTKKIFMGDTGSMIIGFIASVMTIHSISLKNELISYLNFPPQNLPFLLFAVLFLPFFDTFRVIVTRFIQRKHPFHADRQHIHHILLDYLSCSHLKVGLILGGINVVIIALFYLLLNLVDQTIYFGLILLLIVSGFLILHKLSFKSKNN